MSRSGMRAPIVRRPGRLRSRRRSLLARQGGPGQSPPAMPRSRSLAILLLAAPFVSACTALATTPGWVGGGMASEAPVRIAATEAKEERERKIVASQPQQVGARHILIMHDESAAKPDSIHR